MCPEPGSILIVPTNWWFWGSKALISLCRKLKLPTRRSPLNWPKLSGAIATPHGAASGAPSSTPCGSSLPLSVTMATSPSPRLAVVSSARPEDRMSLVDCPSAKDGGRRRVFDKRGCPEAGVPGGDRPVEIGEDEAGGVPVADGIAGQRVGQVERRGVRIGDLSRGAVGSGRVDGRDVHKW